MRRRLSVLATLPVLLAGCGGSSQHSSGTSGIDANGRVGPQVTLAWPAQTRAFAAPGSAVAARIVFPNQGASGGDLSEVETRPAGAAAVTKIYQVGFAIQPGRRLMRVDFLANTNDFVAVASATLNVIVENDGSLRTIDGKPLGAVAYGTNITGLALDAGQTVEVGQKTDLAVSAATLNGVAALRPGSVTFALSNAGLLGLNADGSFTGLAVGSVEVTPTVDGVTGTPVVVAVVAAPLAARVVKVANRDLAYDASRNRIWIALPPTGANGNAVRSLDATTGALGTPIGVGPDPTVLAISDDDSRLYVGLRGAAQIVPVDLATDAVGAAFATPTSDNGPGYALDLAVQPGHPGTVAALTADPYGDPYGPVVFDEGVQRPNVGGSSTGNRLLWGSDTELYAYETRASVYAYAVDDQGLTQTSYQPSIGNSPLDLVPIGNLAYNRGGGILDLATLDQTGAFTFAASPTGALTYGPAVDLTAKRAYFLELGTGIARLHAFDTDTLLETGSRRIANLTLPNDVTDAQRPRLVRVGAKGLAFRLSDQVAFLDDVSGL